MLDANTKTLTANDNTKNRTNKLGFSMQLPFVIESHILRPSSFIKATLSQSLKSSIVFLLYRTPWDTKCPEDSVGFLNDYNYIKVFTIGLATQQRNTQMVGNNKKLTH